MVWGGFLVISCLWSDALRILARPYTPIFLCIIIKKKEKDLAVSTIFSTFVPKFMRYGSKKQTERTLSKTSQGLHI